MRLSHFLLGKPLPEGILTRIIECTSFESMKANSARKAKQMFESDKEKIAAMFGKDGPPEGAPPIFLKTMTSPGEGKGNLY